MTPLVSMAHSDTTEAATKWRHPWKAYTMPLGQRGQSRRIPRPWRARPSWSGGARRRREANVHGRRCRTCQPPPGIAGIRSSRV